MNKRTIKQQEKLNETTIDSFNDIFIKRYNILRRGAATLEEFNEQAREADRIRDRELHTKPR